MWVWVSAAGFHIERFRLLPGKSFTELQLQPATGELQEVVISAGLQSVTRLQSPIPVESYAARFFQRNVTSNLFEALGMVNGVLPQLTCNVCNTGEIRINGLDGPYTLVLIDGMPVVSALSSVYGFMGIPNSLIKRVEVVKGPASTLYGSSAVAGIINIITRDPASANRVGVEHFSTSYGEHNTDLAGSLKVGRSSALLGFNHFRFNQRWDVNQDNFTDVALTNRVSLFNKWNFHRATNQPFNLALRYVYEDRWGGEMQWKPVHRTGNEVYGESIFTNRLEAVGQYGFQVGKEQFISEFSYNLHHQNSAYGEMLYIGRQSTAFAQVRWSRNLGRHRFLAGIPVSRIGYDDNTPATQSLGGGNLPSITHMAGLFAQDEWQHNRLTVLTGLRMELTNVHAPVLAPRLSLKYAVAGNQTLRLTAGNGFRLVNLFTEDHAALTGARIVEIRNRLKPERSWNMNLNYAAQQKLAAGLLSLDVNGFYTHFSNRILPDYFTDPNRIIYDNLDGFAVSRGLSASLDWAGSKGLRFNAGVTWMDVFIADAEKEKMPQLFAPRLSGTYLLSWKYRPWQLTADLSGRWTGPMYLPVLPNDFRPEQSPWFNLLNLQFTWKPAEQVELLAGIRNLFNFLPRNPIMRPFDPFDRTVDDVTTNPFGYTFDPGYNYAPMIGRQLLLGFRVHLDR